MKRELWARIFDESGTIEPALVLIPLLVLVLSTLQIAGGVYARATATSYSQAALYDLALFESDGTAKDGSASDQFSMTSESSFSEFGLPGGGTFLVGEEKHHLPSVTPLLPGGDSFTSHSIVISERP